MQRLLAGPHLLESLEKKKLLGGPNLLSVALTGTGQSRRPLSFISQLLEYPSECGCTHLFCVFIVADIGLAKDRSPFI